MVVAPLLKGAVLSPFKRPRSDRRPPATREVMRGVRVDARRLAAYEEVCGFASGGPGIPVTYPQVLAFAPAMRLMARGDFPLPVLGLVHTSLSIRQLRPLGPGEAYELTVYTADLTPHRRGTQAHQVTEVRAAGGELVWESRNAYLARHATAARGSGAAAEGSGAAAGSGEPAGGSATPPPDAAPAAAPDAAAELPVRAEWRLGGGLGRRYGAVSGDRNPIHLYPLTARAFGFPRAIVHGMWSVARCLAEHGAQESVAMRAEFLKPVLLPATVRYAADGENFALYGGADGAVVHLTGTAHPLTG
jgi:hypothetical protein